MPGPTIRDEIDLGLPHLGAHGLGDSPLLKHLGHLRWLCFERAAGVPTAKVADAKGRRLYATFYYIDMHYPMSAPANAFRENDRVVYLGDVHAYGRNILDGFFAIYRAGDPREATLGIPTVETRETFLREGIPTVRLCNIFIQQEQGPEKLRIGQPANADFSRVPSIREAPEGHERNREARERGWFFAPPEGARLFEHAFEYAIDPDRDVNAAGLVYFANFPAFFEAAERRALAQLPVEVPREFVDRRGTLRRQVGFYGNARANDRLAIRVTTALAREPVEAESPARPHGLLWFSIHVHRASDEALIALTTASRLTVLATEEDVARWRDITRGLGEEVSN